MKNGNNPASPIFDHMGDVFMSVNGDHYGLTKREHFAGLAMQAMLSSKFVLEFNDDNASHDNYLCLRAVRYADALLEELEK